MVFNVIDHMFKFKQEQLQGIMEAAKRTNSPVIIQARLIFFNHSLVVTIAFIAVAL